MTSTGLPTPDQRPGVDRRPGSPLSLALKLAAVGWHVLPLSASSKRPLALCRACRAGQHCSATSIEQCPCLKAGRWCHGVRAATLDRARLAAWWRAEPTAIPAVAAGPSGLVLIDLDAHTDQPPAASELLPGIDVPQDDRLSEQMRAARNGADVLQLLARVRGGSHPWPCDPAFRPVTVATPSGGRHLWYRAPVAGLHQALGALGWQIDIKAGWSYGIAPGASARAGRYEVLAGDLAAPGRIPPWLAREVIRVAASPPRSKTPATRQAPASPRSGSAGYLTAVIERGAAELAALTDGRQRALSTLAYKAGGYLAWSGLPRTEVADRLICAGMGCGLPERLASRIVERSMTNGERAPLHPPRARHQ